MNDVFMTKYFPDGCIPAGEFGKFYTTPEGKEQCNLSTKLENYIASLGRDKIVELEALMVLGRDGPDDEKETPRDCFLGYCEYFQSNFFGDEDSNRRAAEYLASKITLDEYLCKALQLFSPF